MPPIRLLAAFLCGSLATFGASQLRAQAEVRPTAPLPGYAGARVEEGWLPGSDGVRLFYRAVGDRGDTVVYVHGGPGTGKREEYDLEPLVQAGYVLILYDQRGAGYSTLVSDSSRLGLAAHVADLEAVRSRFRLRRLNAIGISWGSAVLLSYAVRHPDRVGRLVFASPVSPTRSHLDARMRHLDSLDVASGDAGVIDRANLVSVFNDAAPDSALATRCREEWRANSRRYEPGGAGSHRPRGDVCDYPAPVLRNRLRARIAGLKSLGSAYDFRPLLRQVRAQVLVVEGRESAVPLDATRVWAQECLWGGCCSCRGRGTVPGWIGQNHSWQQWTCSFEVAGRVVRHSSLRTSGTAPRNPHMQPTGRRECRLPCGRGPPERSKERWCGRGPEGPGAGAGARVPNS